MSTTKPEPNELYVCIESFAAGPGRGATQGARLRGDDEIVQAHPHFFAPADASDPELHELRRALNPQPQPKPKPVGRAKLRVVDGQRVIAPDGYIIEPGKTFAADAEEAQDLVDMGACEVVKKLRSPTKA